MQKMQLEITLISQVGITKGLTKAYNEIANWVVSYPPLGGTGSVLGDRGPTAASCPGPFHGLVNAVNSGGIGQESIFTINNQFRCAAYIGRHHNAAGQHRFQQRNRLALGAGGWWLDGAEVPVVLLAAWL